MNETVANVPYLQQSVSFGRFEHDSLCWERWSTFPTNKYLEEVEKCSTPGSVAQKKAYFEAHYKKIAARKAELLQEQERKEDAELVNSQNRSLVCDAIEEELDCMRCDGQSSVKIEQMENDVARFGSGANGVRADVKSGCLDVFDQENELADLPSEVSENTDSAHTVNDQCGVIDITSENPEHVDDSSANINDEVNEEVKVKVTEHIVELNYDTDVIDEANEVVKYEVMEHIDRSKNGTDITGGSNVPIQEEDAIHDLCPTTNICELEEPMGPVSVTEEVSSEQGFQADLSAQEKVKETITEEEPVILHNLAIPKKMEKATSVKKTVDAPKAKKKTSSPKAKRSAPSMLKSTILSTPKSSKPELVKTAKSAHRPFNKNDNGSTPLTSKKRTDHGSKRVVPTSLHLSINLEPANTDPASGATRKPLIMEKMGDKDIVRRAFKAFQNVTHVPQSNSAKSPATNQSASGKFEQKGSPATTLKKKNDGIRRAAKTDSTLTGQQGTRKSLLSPGLTKNVVTEQKHVKSVAASFGPPVQLHGNTKKAYFSQASRKLEINPKTNVSETSDLQPKVKVDKAAQIKKPSQISTSRTKLSSSYNQGHGFFRKNCT